MRVAERVDVMRDGSSAAGLFFTSIEADETSASAAATELVSKQIELLVDVMSVLGNANISTLPAKIHDVLERVGQYLRVDRIGIVDIDDTGENMLLTDSWSSSAYDRQAANLDTRSISLNAQRSIASRMANLEHVWIDDTDLLDAEYDADREFLQSRGIQAAANLPMTVGGKFTGFLFADKLTQRTWAADRQFLTGVNAILSGAKERYRADVALAESERHHRLLSENAGDVISLADLDGTLRYLSPSCSVLYGARPEDLVGLNAFDLIHAEDVNDVRGDVRRLSTADHGVQLEFRVDRPDATTVWCESTATLVSGRNRGDPYQVQSVTRDVTARHRTQEALEFQAFHDPLTGLPNRAGLIRRLETVLGGVRMPGDTIAVLYLDLDQFKLINDSISHAVGDQLLRAIAGRLSATIRSSDVVARVGGDEFIVVCDPIGGLTEAFALAERVRQVMHEPFKIEEREIRARFSGGLTLAADGVDVSSLLQQADIAANRAKELGRDRIEVFDDTLRAAVRRRTDVEEALHRAVGSEQIVVYYQPIVEMAANQIVGFEALVRWNRPGFGMVGPGDFLDVAADCGLIAALGRQVFQVATQQLSEWHTRLNPTWTMHINVAAQQFDDPAFVSTVCDDLGAAGLDPRFVCVEITESALIGDLERTTCMLSELRDLGFEIAMDDFGTGYSSLSYLQRLPVTTLKIDRSFVIEMGMVATGGAIVEGLIHLAHVLGLSVVAEGVETVEQAEQLRNKGADCAQGFLYAKPLPADAIPSLIADALAATMDAAEIEFDPLPDRTTGSGPDLD